MVRIVIDFFERRVKEEKAFWLLQLKLVFFAESFQHVRTFCVSLTRLTVDKNPIDFSYHQKTNLKSCKGQFAKSFSKFSTG